MEHDLLAGLSLFALVASITPGPNNLMLMASGANFGFRRTLPHLLGVGGGFIVMVMLVGSGISQLFERYPMSFHVLRVVSVLYLGFLALQLMGKPTAGHGGQKTAKPMSFLQAALFQWVNPKAWAMALTAVGVYAPAPSFHAIAIVASVFGLINLPSVTLWALLGQQMRHLLREESSLRRFNAVMAILLIASLLPLLLP